MSECMHQPLLRRPGLGRVAEGISSALGGKKAVFQLPEGPEFVFQDEAVAKRRGWSENLQFYTGLGYLGGAWWQTGVVILSVWNRHG
jgi:hypothetical protein